MGKFDLNAVIQQRIEVAPGLMVIRVVPDGWELPEFTPGQFAVLGLPPEAPRCDVADADEEEHKPGKLIRRAYSIASSSVSREYLKTGDRLYLGPKITGRFTLDEVPDDNDLVLVATGTGLAPYMSMVRTLLPEGGERRIAVLLGARHSWDLGYQSELLTLDRQSPMFTYLPIISRPAEEPVPWGGPAGYVQDLWRGDGIEQVWGQRQEVEAVRAPAVRGKILVALTPNVYCR